MGNHEYNAIAFATPDPHSDGDYLRPRDSKNVDQHRRFLDEIGQDSPEHRAWVEWFRELPLWLERDGLRIVHACWHPEHLRALAPQLDGRQRLTDAALIASARSGTAEHEAVEVLLKGLETPLLDGQSFPDKEGHRRYDIRTRWWWKAPLSYREAALVPPGVEAGLPDTAVDDAALPGYDDPEPVFIGHYWLKGEPAPMADQVACVDYSVADHGKLCAYRWDGEPTLRADRFVWVYP